MSDLDAVFAQLHFEAERYVRCGLWQKESGTNSIAKAKQGVKDAVLTLIDGASSLEELRMRVEEL